MTELARPVRSAGPRTSDESAGGRWLRQPAPHRSRAQRLLRGVVWTGFAAGLLLGGWVLVAAAESWLFFRSAERQPYRTNHLRIGAKQVVSALLEPVYDHRLARSSLLPEIAIDLAPSRQASWTDMLDRVYRRGHALPEDREWLPARFTADGVEHEVDVRGRGTLFTHYKKSKPSFRVRFRGDDFVRGSRSINLIIPYDQARIVADLTLAAVGRQMGLLTYPSRFVTVRWNGDLLGVYQEIEQFRKELAVKQFRSEGFFASSLGEPKGSSLEDNEGFAEAVAAFSACVIAPCDEAAARALLDAYVDRDAMADYAALTTAFGAAHAWGEDNLILFFDPPRGRLEPMPWDMGGIALRRDPTDPWNSLESVKGVGDAFLHLPEFKLARDRRVWDLVTTREDFALAEAQRLYDAVRPALAWDLEHSRDYTDRYYGYFVDSIKTNFALWREHLAASDLRASAEADGVRLVNHGVAAVEVGFSDGGPRVRVPGRHRETVGEAYLPMASTATSLSETRLSATHLVTGDAVEVVWADGGETRGSATLPDGTSRWPTAERAAHPSAGTLPPGIQTTASAWVFSGTVRLDRDLAAPDGVPVRFAPGLELLLGPGVTLVVRGDLDAIGTAEEPIVVRAAEAGRPFGSLAVLGRSRRKAQVRAEHFRVSEGSEGAFRAARFSGMLSIYDGDLTMSDSVIEAVRGEDGLNVKFGTVVVRDSRIEETLSDAVDLDFCRAVVERLTVRRAGGDALDLSGSQVLARDNLFEEITDKGLSVGERTAVAARGNTVRGATTGAAIKDQSLAALWPGPVSDLEIGVSLYQKKQVFGSGSVVLHGPGAAYGGAGTFVLADPEARVVRVPE